ncbi:hypothetical protein DBP19_36380 [Streptomyces sp. CS090A]|uniref:hypothetical protein n=1 Tax=Streptomyces sp. CS090A TaxID=2162710 RepID=UPI000D50BD71|nr:hypothetical protein [Streptomyces sp. CS090A]PVC80618.1 hypothetical protein DBP19_36380 [Streptomyces sp. CS090A]
MAAQLTGSVFVTDPDTHQTVELAPGTSPEPRLAALVTNPAAWVDGKLPRLPKAKTEGDSGASGSDPDGASGDASGDTDPADTQSDETEPTEGDASDGTKPAAKRAARKPARGRTAAAEGTGGQ